MHLTLSATDKKHRILKLIGQSLPFWQAEFAIGLYYFSKGSPIRTAVQDRHWLQIQIYKEWYGSGVYGDKGVSVVEALSDAVKTVADSQVNRSFSMMKQGWEQLVFASEELNHYLLLLELYRKHFSQNTENFEIWGNLWQGQQLTRLRQSKRKAPLGEMAVFLSEGGGLGLFFGMEHALTDTSSSTFDAELIHAVRQILKDEVHHLAGNIRAALQLDLSEQQIEVLSSEFAEICSQKVREREEQFNISIEDLIHQHAVALDEVATIYNSQYLPKILDLVWN